MAAPSGDSAPNGGVGGAFRRRRHRSHQATPYDRPPSSLRIPQSSNGGWLSKIVDPASKIITAGAHKLFSSVFRKRLLPRLEQSKGEIQEPRDSHPEAAAAASSLEDLSGALEGVVNGNTVQNTNIQANGVTELEHILKQKTFTRSEIDRLMTLLHARTSDSSADTREERIELKSHDSQAVHAIQGDPVDGGLQKNIVNTPFLRDAITTPFSRSKLNEDVVASPAEVAKAYMGNRATKVSPSLLGSRSQAQRVEVPEFKTAFHLRTPRVSQMHKPLLTFGNTESSFIAPRSRGRSAIYHMARTPYSRAQPASALKGSGSRIDACDEPSSSSQKAFKRRYSVLENDIGSVGPIRRTRQKSNLHPKSLAAPSSSTHRLTQGIASDAGRASSSFTQPPSGYSFLKAQADTREKNVTISASHVSSKSSEMGERILQQLERLTPPKKLSGKKPEVPGSSSSMELTPDMLHGQARRSLEIVDTLRLLENVQDCGKEVGSVDPVASNMQTSSVLKKDMVDGEVSSKTFTIPSKLENDEANLSSKSSREVAKEKSSAVSDSTADASKRTRTFQISVPEDYLDMDDDVHTNGFASSSMNGGKQLMEKSDVPSMASEIPENPIVLGLNKTDKTPMFSELEPSDLLNKQASPEPFVLKPTASGQSFCSSLPVALGSSSTCSAVAESVSAQTTRTVDKSVFASPASSFGINGSDKVSTALFSSSASAVEASVSADAKPHLLSSTVGFSTTTADATKILPGSENKSTEATDAFKKSKSIPVSSVSGPSTSIFSFGAPTTNSTATNGFTCSSTETSVSLSSPALFSNQSSSNGFGQVNFTASSVATTATANAPITGSLTTSTAFASFSSSPTVKEGSSSVASASELSVVFTDTSGSAAKLKEFSFGSNSVNMSSSATDTGPKSTGFQLEASTSGILSQASHNDNSSKPIFGNLNNTATALGTMTQSALSQSTSSTMSPASSGLSGSVFGSSIPPPSSGFTFGSSSSSSLSTTASASTNSGSTGIFGSSWQAPDSAASFSSTNSKASSGFAFGVSPSTSIPAVTASTGFTFGLSSSPAPASNVSSGFSFGASSSAYTSAQTSNTLSGLSFGASSSSSTSAQTSNTSSGFSFGNPANNGTPPVFNFGTSSTSTPAGTITSSSPFQFGASSGSALTSSSTSMFTSVNPPAPGFSFGAASTSSITPQPSPQPVFGNGGSVFPFGPTPSPSGNGNQMSMEDTMAEDSTPPPAAHVFGHPPNAQQQPSSEFVFGTPPAQPMATNPFQFGGQQSQVGAPQNSSPFQLPGGGAGGSFELGAGGSFSLGAGGNDKSNRKIVKVKSKFRRK